MLWKKIKELDISNGKLTYDEERNVRKSLINKIEKEGDFIKENYSKSDIERFLNNELESVDEKSDLKDLLKSISRRFTNLRKYEVFIPIYNLEAGNEVFEYKNCRIKEFSDSIRGRILEARYPDEISEMANDRVKDYYEGAAVAIIDIRRGSYNKAMEDSKKVLNEVVDILYFFKNFLYSESLRPMIGLTDNLAGLQSFFAINKKDQGLSSRQERKGALASYRLGQLFDKFDQSLIESVKSCFVNSGGIQNRVERCIHWVGKAERAESEEDEFIMYIIALESLLGNEKTNITFNLSKRVSFILGEDLEDRNEVFDSVKKVYDKRGDLVHGEDTELTKKDLLKASHFVRNTALYLADNLEKYDDFGDLDKKIKSRFFSLPSSMGSLIEEREKNGGSD
ncbi:MAG: hypothetical protein BTN85_0793 [Candidatus Methanohalarchaeum thermophilum]|uniref:Uncharacterized protein n=1 Tax=Methanohalarchaeum thermophilum TaxID=1903181 RepID=A0A1Q6DVC3_METT1|nr:MAG: hypothetical protein BTN85_0793 [Candidatus Methanohalarchaeum thermophilum]